MNSTWRASVADVLEDGERYPVARAAFQVGLIVFVGGSVASTTLETVDVLAARAGGWFGLVELVAVLVMAGEYLLRLWTAPETEPDGGADPWRARFRYLRSPLGVIDLLAVLPFLVSLVVSIPADGLRLLRLLRLLKIARYTPALGLFAAVLRNERRPLLATLLVVAVLLVLESAVMHVLERDAQPKVFASIPHAMWWAIVTIATVGYGDTFPVTPAGKVFAGLVMVIGIAIFAVPAGILATGFASEIRKRDFVVTWQTVARVPLFAGLDATRIAEIAQLLKRQVVPPQFVLVRRGEPADAMFFIMSGQVEVDVPPLPVRLGPGQYFGEIALIRDTVRTATVTSVTECQLLALDTADFRRLVETHPTLRATISRTAEERLTAVGGAPPGPPAPPS